MHEHTNIGVIKIDFPEKANALDMEGFKAIAAQINHYDNDPATRVIIIYGAGSNFCAGLDLKFFKEVVGHYQQLPPGKNNAFLHKTITEMQAAVNSISQSNTPVIVCVQGNCLGAGLDIVSACDYRIASEDAVFSIKEVDLGIVADLGSLQRLPAIIGEGRTRALAMSGRNFTAQEALTMGLLSEVVAIHELEDKALEIAENLCSKSPAALQGIKKVMNFSAGKTVEEGMSYTAAWNAAMMLSADLMEIQRALVEKRPPEFK